MLFRQVVDDDLGCASYLVGDEDAGEAVVVDPAFGIEQYLEKAERDGVRIVARARDAQPRRPPLRSRPLRARARPAGHVHPAAEPEFPFEALEDGTEVRVGQVVLRALHTPGHRPEHCCFAVIDRSRAEEPWLVLTGDSLFVGDAARPDLAVAAIDGARGLYQACAGCSTWRRRRGLPRPRRRVALRRRDELEGVDDDRLRAPVQPRAPPRERARTFVAERRPARRRDRRTWSGSSRSTAGRSSPPRRPRASSRRPGGAHRARRSDAAEFARGHLPGAINIPVSGTSFATKAGFVLLPEEPVVVHGSTREEADQAVRGLHAIGFLELAGCSSGTAAARRRSR